MSVKIVTLLALVAILILVFVIAALYNKYNDLKKEDDVLHSDFYAKCDDLATARAEMSEDFQKKVRLRSELFEAWRVLHLCNKQRRYYRKLAVIMNAAEKEALRGNIAVIKKGKDKLAVLSNERLQYFLDVEHRCQYLDAKMKLNETPETRDSFERANYEKYMDEFKANKKRLQEIIDDYECPKKCDISSESEEE